MAEISDHFRDLIYGAVVCQPLFHVLEHLEVLFSLVRITDMTELSSPL